MPLIRQFFQQIAFKFQLATHNNQNEKMYPTSLYSVDSTDDHFRYAQQSSIYSADSFCSQSSTAANSVFEKTYVSFPDYYAPSTTSNRTSFTKPEVITATATPTFYNTPHVKPIWIA